MSGMVTELEAFTLLHVATRRDPGTAAATLSAALGAAVVTTPGSVAAGNDGIAVLWFGPGRWLVHAPRPGWKAGGVGGCAVTDLSDSRRVFRLSGNGAAGFLSASCPLDLSVRSMPPGTCALTQFDRFSILLHRRAPDAFDLYVERSFVPAMRLPA